MNSINSINLKKIIGRAEYVWLVGGGIKKVPARIDTGARTSSIWASNICLTDTGLTYELFGKGSEFYTGDMIIQKSFAEIVVASSNGHLQKRYKIPMTIQIRGRRIKTYCTLADRSSQAYPILIGRNTLKGKFIVDVQRGVQVLDEMDQARFDQLQTML